MSPKQAPVDPHALARYRAEIEALRTAWKSSGESVRALGRRAGVSHPTVSKILDGEKRSEWSKVLPIVRELGGNEELLYSLWQACFEPSSQTALVAASNGESRKADSIALAALIASAAILRAATKEAERLRSDAREEYFWAKELARKTLDEAHATIDVLIDEAIQTANAVKFVTADAPVQQEEDAGPHFDAEKDDDATKADRRKKTPVQRSGWPFPRSVPKWIVPPDYVGKAEPSRAAKDRVQSPETIEAMRTAGQVAARALAAAGAVVQPGVTTDEIDRVVHEFLTDRGAYPSFRGLGGYRKSCTVSRNEVVCLGVPNSTLIEDGDIVGVDLGAFIGGVHAATGATFLAGRVETEDRLLVESAREATKRAIKAVRPGSEVGALGRAVESYAERVDYNVMRDFTGHGIGRDFYNDLIVINYDDPSRRLRFEPGMTFTVEPIITRGGSDYAIAGNGSTAIAKDGARSAFYKHTIVVTEAGSENLTELDETDVAGEPETEQEGDVVWVDEREEVLLRAPHSPRQSGWVNPFTRVRHPPPRT